LDAKAAVKSCGGARQYILGETLRERLGRGMATTSEEAALDP
jgi:hypothetical protein